MPCRSIDLGGGARAIICSRGRREQRCSVCKIHVGDKLCDGRVGTVGISYGDSQRATKAKTCDAPLCRCCAVTRPDPKKKDDTLDYCPRCAKNVPPEQLPMGGP